MRVATWTKIVLGVRPSRIRLVAYLALIAAAVVFLRHLAGSPYTPPLAPALPVNAAGTSSSQHVALIFDENRISYAAQLVRSMAAYGGQLESLRFHLVAPPAAMHEVGIVLDELNLIAEWYDYAMCDRVVAPLRPFANEAIHTSALCKVFLSDIIVGVDRVLYIDTDATVVGNIDICMQPLPRGALFGMALDMGDVCQIWPGRCWPLSLQFVPWGGLVCGNVPKHHQPSLYTPDDAVCSPTGKPEPAQVNGGVVLMELSRMRQAGFVPKLLRSTARAFLLAGRRRATWAEQEFLNSYIREYPDDFAPIPCGCNYQYDGTRREAKCAGQPVHIVHHWSRNAARRTPDPYNRLFHHFRLNHSGPAPPFPQLSTASDFSPSGPVHVKVDTNCVGQPYNCSGPAPPSRWGDLVYVLTRTAGRPRFFEAARQSVLNQTYPYLRHFVVTDDPASMGYLDDVGAELVRRTSRAFDPDEVCRQCQHLNEPENTCGQAPGLDKPGRQPYLECYCSTHYPMNELVNHLLRRVQSAGEPGWIVILDDDNIFNSTSAISDLMLDVEHLDQLLLFQSRLGRLTPTDEAMRQLPVVRGDIDASNYLFHSSRIEDALWDARRCADWRTIDRLSRILGVKWSATVPISAHPQRAELGGMGNRRDLPDPPLPPDPREGY